MAKTQKGFGLLTLLLVLCLGGISLAGFWVYSQNQKQEPPKNTPIIDEKVESKIVLAVGDIACAPSDPNFNSAKGQNGFCKHEAVVEAMNKEKADLVLILGDIQYPDGKLDDYKRSFIPAYKKLNTPMMVVPGNHEYDKTGSLEGYKQAFSEAFAGSQYLGPAGETYHSKVLGDWKLIGLDSDCEYVAGGCAKGSPQYQWFESEIKKTKGKCALAFWHHPVISTGAYANNQTSKSRASDFWSLFYGLGGDLVLVGHEHYYERFAPLDKDLQNDDLGLRQIIVGTGGVSLRPPNLVPNPASQKAFGDQFGYLKLELYPDSYSWKFINVQGQTLDSGQTSCR